MYQMILASANEQSTNDSYENTKHISRYDRRFNIVFNKAHRPASPEISEISAGMASVS